MIRKKQAAMITSIAFICFLIGTSMASNGGNPFDSLWDAFNGLESRIEALENQSLPLGFMGAPAYDSGWQAITADTYLTLTHNLGTKELFVYMLGKDVVGTIGTMFYGSDLENGTWRGAYFRINAENTIDIRRLADDAVWLEVRVYIWVIS
ncbi:MAG: hypothetical protein JSV85_02800 [Candidatus Bathyarchaeota archaeon]|nr:MAG: hypothetical protein JSV85_02800 [Candidatus Bathyarchaeota archaeon]